MYINKCYHIDGTEMDKNYKIEETNKIAEELLDFLAHTGVYSQNTEEDVQNIA